MAFLKRNALKDKVEADRQKAIVYKKVFGTPEGREVLFDLMNRYHVLNSTVPRAEDAEFKFAINEGERRVILDIMTRANIDLAQFDRLLKGELT